MTVNEPLPDKQRDLPAEDQKHDPVPDVENHPVIRATKLVLEIHAAQVDRIQNYGEKLFRTNPETGEKEDVTAQVLGESMSAISQGNELIDKVRVSELKSGVPDDFEGLTLNVNDYDPAKPLEVQRATLHPDSITSQVVTVLTPASEVGGVPEHLPPSADDVADDPMSSVNLPEDR